MRRTVAVAVLALLTVTAGCSAVGSTTGSENPTNPAAGTGQTVAVSASGQLETAPDKALIRVAVTARADSVETVRQQLARNASRMRTALQDAGLAADQIVSARYDIGRNFRGEDRPSAPTFRGEHSFILTLNEPDRAGEVVVTAVENGATTVDEVRFTITQQTRRELREQALAQAVMNARGKASVIANGTGLTLADVRTVQTADVSIQPERRQEVALTAAADAGAGGISTSFEGGKVTVTARVTVVYNATTT